LREGEPADAKFFVKLRSALARQGAGGAVAAVLELPLPAGLSAGAGRSNAPQAPRGPRQSNSAATPWRHTADPNEKPDPLRVERDSTKVKLIQ
tara:strand:- start:7564 stop:7842 length:279 start_codon:yes stop_codon:yes gene_type:complete